MYGDTKNWGCQISYDTGLVVDKLGWYFLWSDSVSFLVAQRKARLVGVECNQKSQHQERMPLAQMTIQGASERITRIILQLNGTIL